MKISLRWLRDYAPLDAPAEALQRALVDTGTEVDSISRSAHGAVVARVAALQAVPESTKGALLVDLEIGRRRRARVVTMAQNLHAGDLVPYAPPGTVVVGATEPLGVRAMFGGKYESSGMLCSAVELGVGVDADGILVLERGRPGQPVEEVLDLDAVFEVEVTSNRPDCLCHLGIARELAASLGEPLREPPSTVPEVLLSATAVATRATVRIDDAAGCPRFCVRVIENVAVGPSPDWLQRRLRTVGLRPINNVVDVTNYVAAELGQPLHAFDLDRFRNETPGPATLAEVVVRRAHPGERLLCLDEVERTLDAEDIVVCAGERAVSLAGVIGGARTAVDGATRHVLLEAACWDGPRIRATSRRLNLRTDASWRFEKGLSDTLAPWALERATALIAELGGGHVLRGLLDEHPAPLPAIGDIHLRAGDLERILGYPVDPTEAATMLARLGFAVEQDGGDLYAVPPHFRRDVRIPEDVAEEVGRSLGYARVPATLPGRRTAVETLAPPPSPVEQVRDICCAAGFDEAITWSFLAPARARRLAGVGEGRLPIPLRNPLSEEWSVLRVSLLPGLCGALARNQQRGAREVALFEIGRVFWEGERSEPVPGTTPDGADAARPPLPLEPLLLGLVSQPGDADAETTAASLRHAQSVLASLSHEMGAEAVTVEPAVISGLRAGRAGRLVAAGRPVGVLGELDAAALAAYELRGRVVVAELRLDAVVRAVPRTPRFVPPPRLPAVEQDLSVVVPDTALARDAYTAVRQAGAPLLESVEIVDEYRSERLGSERKGWTFHIVYRAADRTLSGDEVQPVHERVATALTARLGAEVRR